MSETIRSFVAIELPEHVISMLRGVQDDLRRNKFRIKWVQPDNIHLTLKFLGNVDSNDIDGITAAMSVAIQGCGPITLCAKGVGVFPGLKRARVIWIGLGGQVQRLSEMQGKLEKNLAEIGFSEENRSFKAHLTIGRFKSSVNPKVIGPILQKYSAIQSEEFILNQIVLFKSDLTPSGPVYSVLQRVVF